MQTAMQTGTPVLATNAVRRGKSSNMTAITTTIEMRISFRNDRTESLTTLGWSVIRWK